MASSASPVPSNGTPAAAESPLRDLPDPSAETSRSVRQGLSVQSRDRIANQLRAMYDTVANQPVPDRFAELIAKLDAADRSA
ncbi:NepR family anti-sigma factor [Methylobacterium aerolatum]|uniref:Anti-sigma factor NepR domain-containing protein n=1 Tax=Methylobacterium aerolatum TaxID=418708 RepID=A0ABU0HWC0_9HYPH|nr:NepR family anti-sigma factor [Methylobacterium aerolatum]MDQ0446616.1 hypothetical protein [Methylobacterium aerolatum]